MLPAGPVDHPGASGRAAAAARRAAERSRSAAGTVRAHAASRSTVGGRGAHPVTLVHGPEHHRGDGGDHDAGDPSELAGRQVGFDPGRHHREHEGEGGGAAPAVK